ncbi:fungal hydrophobin [Hygrophoropsis aurantiaca]|uniref:Fungal hydrophobin n=1 Tax=Hygrophoropsis aurantiaca TaxID=72124 RepID=A0ACB8AGH3_9AGAM|nr:fungal hydrophobin [Hygrophoropsis aurantiaca]
MFSKSTLILTVLVGLVAARPPNNPYPPQPGQAIHARGYKCPLGEAQCCPWTGKASDPQISHMWDALRLETPHPESLVGIGCQPSTSADIQSDAVCKPVCCDKNHDSGISIGCGPIKE